MPQQRKSQTGRRKRTKVVDVSRLTASGDRGPEVLRQLLLALVTALIVARPIVLGEDPGLLNRLSSAWGLVLSLLWFVAAIGWAVWRASSRQIQWRGSAVEVGLLSIALLMWLSAGVAAHYKHPALLISSEWLVLFIAFCLVRQLARTPSDDRGLLAALVASAVSISAFALYQYTVEFPQIRRTYGTNLEALLDAMAAENVVANPELLQRRLLDDNVFGTYSHPNSLASYLALLLPVVIAWTLKAKGKSRTEEAKPSYLLPLAFCLATAGTLLVGLALWLTHSRGAILGSLFVGLAVLAVYGRRFFRAHKAVLLTVLAVMAVGTVLLFRTDWLARGITKFWESSQKRTDYWIATWSMIGDHPWLGVGPGNFGRLYPRYMPPRAFEQVKDPHNFLLEMWATGGAFALLALVITLGMFFRRAWSLLRSPWSVSAMERATAQSTGQRAALRAPHAALQRGEPWIRWEFCVGGMVGLVLGFVLRALNQSPDEVLLEGASSACRSIIWFTAFALFYSIPWSGTSRSIAMTAGVAALLFNLLFSGGIALPSVAQPLWIMVALTLNSLSDPVVNETRDARWLQRILPLPILGGIGLAYFVLLCYPALDSGDALSKARRHYPVWHAGILPRWRGIVESDQFYLGSVVAYSAAGPLHPLPLLSVKPGDLPKFGLPVPMLTHKPEDLRNLKLQASLRASHELKAGVLDPLEYAVSADLENASAWLELAEWYGELCKILPEAESTLGHALGNAFACAEHSHQLDPDNKDPFLFEHGLHMQIAQRFREREREEYGHAAVAMLAAVERDLTNARLRYQLAETLFLANLPVDGRRHAQIAHELDQQATRPERKLTGPQRGKVSKWLRQN
jgi:O-Antigen ligase